MRRRALLLGLLFSATTAFCDNAKLYINGEEVSHTQLKITASGDDVLVTFDDGTPASANAVDLAAICVVFNDTPLTKILERKNDIGIISRTVGNTIHIDGVTPDAVIAVYSADGRLVASQKAKGTNVDVDIAGASAGTYLLKVNDSIIKFVKR